MSTLSDSLLVGALGAAIGSLITVAIKDGLPAALKAYKSRRIEAKKAQQQYLLEQAEWFQGRAAKLKTLEWQLRLGPDKFKLAKWVSELDRDDQQWAMKISDLEQLRKSVADKATECENNATESSLLAFEVSHRLLL